MKYKACQHQLFLRLGILLKSLDQSARITDNYSDWITGLEFRRNNMIFVGTFNGQICRYNLSRLTRLLSLRGKFVGLQNDACLMSSLYLQIAWVLQNVHNGKREGTERKFRRNTKRGISLPLQISPQQIVPHSCNYGGLTMGHGHCNTKNAGTYYWKNAVNFK